MNDAEALAAGAAYPSPAEVRRLLRRLRRDHRHGQWADRATDMYVIALALATTLGLIVSSVHRVPVGAWRVANVPAAASASLLAAVLLFATGVATVALRSVGPLYASPATQTWLLAAPTNRAGWLRRRVAGLAGGAAAVGALIGLAVAALGFPIPLVDVPDSLVTTVCFAAAATVTLTVGLAHRQQRDAAAAEESGHRPVATDGVRLAGAVLILAGAVAAVVGIVASDSRRTVTGPSGWGAGILATVIGALLAAACVLVIVRALQHAGDLDRASLTGGAALAGSALAATMSADPTFLFGFVEAQRLRRIGRVRSRALSRRGPIAALLDAEGRRLARHRTPLLVFVAMIVVPYAAAVVVTDVPVTLVRVLAGYVAVNAVAAGLRTVSRSPALRRSLGRTDGWLRGVHLVVPSVAALVYVVATAWSGRTYEPALDVVLAAGLVLAALRTATRPPMVYDTAWLVTPLGLLPVGLITQIIRGPDVAVVLAAVFAFVIR